MNQTCDPGGSQGVGSAQTLNVTVDDANGHGVANASVAYTVGGANPISGTTTTDSQGAASFSLTGTAVGDTSITAKATGAGLPSGGISSNAVDIAWVKATHTLRRIIYVHGVNEDATDFSSQVDSSFHDPDGLSPQADASQRTMSAMLHALTLMYDPHYMKVFCYVDDHAYGYASGNSDCDPSEQSFIDPGCARDHSKCHSQSSVTRNALALAALVDALHVQDATTPNPPTPITLIGYSMGGSIIRTMMAGCVNPQPNGPPPLDLDFSQQQCLQASQEVSHVFFVDGVQAGSWLMTLKQGFDAGSFSSDSVPDIFTSPFRPIMPLIAQVAHDKVKAAIGLDSNLPAEQDMTPRSLNILAHNNAPPPQYAKYYNFYGDVHVKIGVTVLVYPLPGTTDLPLGDLVLLPQSDTPTNSPRWGGETICGACRVQAPGYEADGGDTYHQWAVTQNYDFQVGDLAPVLQGQSLDPRSSVQKVLNSPATHLGITQPTAQVEPSIKVHDITGSAGSGGTTEVTFEILAILQQTNASV